jgi:RNA recognition motif-containing protein
MVPETPLCVQQASHEMTTIIVRNLPRTITLEELRERFQRYGVVRNINLPRNKDPHSPYYGTIRKFAFIQYNTAAESDRAVREISTHGHFIYGNQVTAAKSDTVTCGDNPTLSR